MPQTRSKGRAMRFLIIGAGALGGYYGGMLLKGGADVTFLVRPRRAAQLAERGLTIKSPEGGFATAVRIVQSGAVGGPYDVVFLACKAYDLDGAIDDFAPVLAADGVVLPVLNGINHIAVLSNRLGAGRRSEEHTSELQSRRDLVCRLLLEKKKNKNITQLLSKKKTKKKK